MHANPKTKGRILCAEDDADSLLLVDNRMPGLSGADLEVPSPRVQYEYSFYSGADLTSMRPATSEAQGYLTKPLEISDLLVMSGELIADTKIAFTVAIHLP